MCSKNIPYGPNYNEQKKERVREKELNHLN